MDAGIQAARSELTIPENASRIEPDSTLTLELTGPLFSYGSDRYPVGIIPADSQIEFDTDETLFFVFVFDESLQERIAHVKSIPRRRWFVDLIEQSGSR